MNKVRLELESIRECLDRNAAYTSEGEAALLDSHLVQDGVDRNLISIGVATKNPSADLRAAANPDPISQKWR